MITFWAEIDLSESLKLAPSKPLAISEMRAKEDISSEA